MTTTRVSTAAEATTVSRAFHATAERFADRPALCASDGRIEWTWGDYARGVDAAAAGLSGFGVKRGDVIACWLSNRPEFHVADAATLSLGAASFSIYPTCTIEEAEHVVRDAGARVAVVEASTLGYAKALRAGGNTALETIVVVDEPPDATVMSWGELLECAAPDFDLEAHVAAVQPDDLVTLSYTSGTTGAPKGVQITHRNVMAQVAALSRRLGLPAGISAISWLPMAHAAERLCSHYLPISHGWQVTTCDSARAIGAVLAEVHPEFFCSTPRLWEELRAAALAKAGGELPVGEQAAAIVTQLGLDRIRMAMVGAAPCLPEVIEFWLAVGVSLGEVYGLSETTGLATVNPPDAVRVGTAGTPLDGVDVRLGESGEILVRGPVVMSGYRNLPEKTAEAIDADGWLHTGDVGVFDEHGYLRIVDRIEESRAAAADGAHRAD